MQDITVDNPVLDFHGGHGMEMVFVDEQGLQPMDVDLDGYDNPFAGLAPAAEWAGAFIRDKFKRKRPKEVSHISGHLYINYPRFRKIY